MWCQQQQISGGCGGIGGGGIVSSGGGNGRGIGRGIGVGNGRGREGCTDEVSAIATSVEAALMA